MRALRDVALMVILAVLPMGIGGCVSTGADRQAGELTVEQPRSQAALETAPVMRDMRPAEGQVWTVPEMNLAFVWIKPGTFTMGSLTPEAGRGDDERAHEVVLTRGYWLGTYEVRVEDFEAFVESTKYRTQAESEGWAYAYDSSGKWGETHGASWRNPGFKQGEDHPVLCVSWNDAATYCEWLTSRERDADRLPSGYAYRLPTESEWEYACRAGTRTAYVWGDDPDGGKGWCNGADQSARRQFSDLAAFSWDDGYVYTSPVGSFEASSWGLYDMHGNVWEWCADWHGSYPAGRVTDPVGPGWGRDRVVRGGSWSYGPNGCRSADRSWGNPSRRSIHMGFRVALARVL